MSEKNMEIEQILLKLNEVYNENGILVDNPDDMIVEYIPDSVIFISIIIGIEEAFDIELPDELLIIENLGTTTNLAQRLLELLGGF